MMLGHTDMYRRRTTATLNPRRAICVAAQDAVETLLVKSAGKPREDAAGRIVFRIPGRKLCTRYRHGKVRFVQYGTLIVGFWAISRHVDRNVRSQAMRRHRDSGREAGALPIGGTALMRLQRCRQQRHDSMEEA